MTTGLIILHCQDHFTQGKYPPALLKTIAAKTCSISYHDIKSSSRKEDLVTARKLIVYEAKINGYKWWQIADMIGRTVNDAFHLNKKAKHHIATADQIFIQSYVKFKGMLNGNTVSA